MEPHCIEDLEGSLQRVRTLMAVVDKLEMNGN